MSLTILRCSKPMNLTNRLYRQQLKHWLGALGMTHAITLNANMDRLPLVALTDKFGKFCLEIDRLKFRMKNVFRRASADRFLALGFPEHLASNSHLHLAARFDHLWFGRPITADIEAEVWKIWRRITLGHGLLEMKSIYGISGWADYITKELAYLPNDELRNGVQFLWSADFHPVETVIQSGNLHRTLEQLKRTYS